MRPLPPIPAPPLRLMRTADNWPTHRARARGRRTRRLRAERTETNEH